MIVLDTNVLSELMRREPDARVMQFFERQPPGIVATTAITAAELQFGVEALPDGRRKSLLANAVTEMLSEDFADAVLPFDALAAEAYGVIAAWLRQSGTPVGQNDTMIAAIVYVADATLVTPNSRHFINCGINVIDPFGAD